MAERDAPKPRKTPVKPKRKAARKTPPPKAAFTVVPRPPAQGGSPRRAPIPTKPVPTAAPPSLPELASVAREGPQDPAVAEPAAGPGAAFAIELRGLRRTYGNGKIALEGATFQVQRGEVFGFLGPNGAGKTTTIRILAGLLRPTGGEAWILGQQAGPGRAATKALVGYVPEEPAFPAQLKALPLLKAYGRFHGLEGPALDAKARELLRFVGLEGQENVRTRTFSHGMRKRFALAQALLHDPPLLILDEPTSGLDPAGTAWFRDFVRTLRHQGKTVFLSSHLLHEVQQMCDRVGIIHQGHILAVNTIEGLARLHGEPKVRILVTADEDIPDAVLASLRGMGGVADVRREATGLVVEAAVASLAADVNAELVKWGVRVRAIEVVEPSLEDVFLRMTQGVPP